MHKNATKCNKILSKWCKNKHGASKVMDTLETYHYFIKALIFQEHLEHYPKFCFGMFESI
jgi:hypothetical protein